jgi:hypothetical protein
VTRNATRIVLAVIGAAALAAALVFVTRTRGVEPDPLIADFRATERTCLHAFNDALRRQRVGEIDELGLAAVIDRDVLPPWRGIRVRAEETREIPERQRALYETLRRYLRDRESAWEAYSAALRAPTEAAARPLLDRYHQKNTEADGDARVLGPQL